MNTPGKATNGRALIEAERRRQVDVEGYGIDHDIEHGMDALRRAARCYLTGDVKWWPWDARYWKPKDRLSDLIRAGALFKASRDVAGALGGRIVYRDGEMERCEFEIDALLDRARTILADQGVA